MVFVATIIRKVNPLSVASSWKVLSAAPKHFSSSTGYSQEEIEYFRKVFRTMPSYDESISSKELIPYLKAINYVKPMEAYQKYIEYADKVLGGRFEMNQIMKYINAQHDPRLLMNEYLANFDANKDGYVSKDEFEFGIQTIRVHDPRIRHVAYDKFLKEADTNRDGKVSVAECKAWLEKNLVPA